MEHELLSAEEQGLLDAVPAYLSISQMLKATPITEGGDRFIYLEASNESLDQQGEVVLAKALADSSAYYLKFGNLDIDHFTQIGARSGIPNYELFEIGRPVDVAVRDGSTFVKGQIYSGNGPAAERANSFWSSLTDLNPPARWYPSVGGSVIGKSVVIDPATNGKKAVINKVRWTNIGFSKTPVNANLATVSTVPFGALAKSLCAGGGWDFAKAIEAGYGSDASALSGGGALRKQSLEPGVLSYWDFRDGLADLIRTRKVGVKPADLVKVAQDRFGMSPDVAAASVERFLGDLEQRRFKQ